MPDGFTHGRGMAIDETIFVPVARSGGVRGDLSRVSAFVAEIANGLSAVLFWDGGKNERDVRCHGG